MRLVQNELDIVSEWVSTDELSTVLEAGCGSAQLLQALLRKNPRISAKGLEVDLIQHQKNLALDLVGLEFVLAGAQDLPYADASMDLTLMLKSLHHVPIDKMQMALNEMHRVLKPGGILYVSEPVYAGELNHIMCLFNDEQVVRAYAQQALDSMRFSKQWSMVSDVYFEMPASYVDFNDFYQKMLNVSFTDRKINADILGELESRFNMYFAQNQGQFHKPMHVTCLRKAV